MSDNTSFADHAVGDLIAFRQVKGLYYHWAVYVGERKIVHFQKVEKHGRKTEILCERLDEYIRTFKTRPKIMTKKHLGVLNGLVHDTVFSGREVAERALSQVGKKGYNLVFNNCEHFAKWCKYNVAMSEQMENKVEAALVLTGMGSGGATGALIGTVVAGPLGTVIGGGIGAGLGVVVGVGALGVHWFVTTLGRKAKKGHPY